MENNVIQQIMSYSKKIVVMAPSFESNAYRVYANGGVICLLTPKGDHECILETMNKKYVKYLSDVSKGNSELSDLIQRLNHKSISKITEQFERYIDLAIHATERRFHNCERQYQTELARISRDYFCTNPENIQWLIVDMEYTSPKKISSKSENGKAINYKPDFIVFDGESFGVIELKCNGNTGNNFSKHCDDFNKMLSEYGKNHIQEFISRFRTLVDIGVIDKKLEYTINEFEKTYRSKDIKEIAWIGFIFEDTYGKNGHTVAYRKHIQNIQNIDFVVPVKIKHIVPKEYADKTLLTQKLVSDQYLTIEEYII